MAAEGLPGQGHGGPQGEADALDVVGHGHRRDEIGGDGQGLQRRAQGAAGAGPVGAAHQAHPRLPEGRGHLGQVIGAHQHIPVGDHQEVIPGPGHKLAQGADFRVEAQIFRTDDHLQVAPGMSPGQFPQERQHRVIRVPHPEEHLVGVVILGQKARQAFPGAGVQALEGLEDGDAGAGCHRRGRGRGAEKSPQGDQGQKLVDTRLPSEGEKTDKSWHPSGFRSARAQAPG